MECSPLKIARGMCTRQDKNKKKSAAIPSPFASMQSQSKPGANPYGKKT
jgi:hypothetical protein